MSEVILTINISGYCSHVSDPDLNEHLEGIAFEISEYAKRCADDDWSRKIQVDYETQEDVNLSITTDTKTT